MENTVSVFDIEERTFAFAAAVIRFCKSLDRRWATDRDIARQLARSATSIGANIAEAQGAPSKADFINKNFIALKEARETLYWLRLIHESVDGNHVALPSLIKETRELKNILAAIVYRARRNAMSEN